MMIGIDPSPGDDPGEVPAAVAALLRRRGRIMAGPLERLAAGGNNRIFRARCEDGASCVVKAYHRAAGDGRDRYDSERRFYRFAQDAAPAWTAASLEWDPAAAIGLFEEIRGRRLQPGLVGEAEVAAALDFFRAINGRRRSAEAAELPIAAEACFSAAEHLQSIEGRLERLQSGPAATPVEREARDFVSREILPPWRRIKTAAAAAADSLLGSSERCISPSDFGFHNCLVRDGGSLVFLDFEYAGWDDPAKTVCDFFCQPAVPVPMSFFERFSGEVSAALGGGEKFLARCRALLPAYRVKWCGIMLNEFVASGRERRSFALGAEAMAARQERQLGAARSALAALIQAL
jgi:Phosphotransferase enzyme family